MREEIPKIPFLKKRNAQLEFEIFTISSLFSRKHKLDHPLDMPHRVAFYNILYITKGSGRHYIDFRPYKFAAGSILFISKGQVHAFAVRPDTDGFLILFTDAYLSKNLIHIDSEHCLECGSCKEACPENAIEPAKGL